MQYSLTELMVPIFSIMNNDIYTCCRLYRRPTSQCVPKVTQRPINTQIFLSVFVQKIKSFYPRCQKFLPYIYTMAVVSSTNLPSLPVVGTSLSVTRPQQVWSMNDQANVREAPCAIQGLRLICVPDVTRILKTKRTPLQRGGRYDYSYVCVYCY